MARGCDIAPASRSVQDRRYCQAVRLSRFTVEHSPGRVWPTPWRFVARSKQTLSGRLRKLNAATARRVAQERRRCRSARQLIGYGRSTRASQPGALYSQCKAHRSTDRPTHTAGYCRWDCSPRSPPLPVPSSTVCINKRRGARRPASPGRQGNRW